MSLKASCSSAGTEAEIPGSEDVTDYLPNGKDVDK